MILSRLILVLSVLSVELHSISHAWNRPETSRTSVSLSNRTSLRFASRWFHFAFRKKQADVRRRNYKYTSNFAKSNNPWSVNWILMSFRGLFLVDCFACQTAIWKFSCPLSTQLPPLIYFEVRKRCFHFRLIFQGDKCSVCPTDILGFVAQSFFAMPPSWNFSIKMCILR